MNELVSGLKITNDIFLRVIEIETACKVSLESCFDYRN